jgi:hypothetical protein
MAKTFTLSEIEEAIADQAGFCIKCGAVRDCCEPDARQYECDECGAHSVYGAEEILIMGLIKQEVKRLRTSDVYGDNYGSRPGEGGEADYIPGPDVPEREE